MTALLSCRFEASVSVLFLCVCVCVCVCDVVAFLLAPVDFGSSGCVLVVHCVGRVIFDS